MHQINDSFKIVVCIKQVPDTDDIKWTQQNTIQREGLDSIINPFDLGAIQLAKNIKFLQKNAEIIAVTMGPKQAESVLKTAIALGADKGYLLSDKKFSGSDTLATAYTLSQFVKTIVPDFKLIICGQQAVDGDTAQTPSSLAEKLNIPQITNVIALKDLSEEHSIWISETQQFKNEIKTPHPALIAAKIKDITIIPDINGYINAQTAQIRILNAEETEINPDFTGFLGSPTQVKSTFRPINARNTMLIEDASIKDSTDYILNEINKCKVKND